MLVAPDAEGACLAALRAAGVTARDVLAPPYPAVRVVRVGGGRARILDEALVQIDAAVATGQSKAVALFTLEHAIAVLREAEGKQFGGAQITAVQVSGAPMYVPDPGGPTPRYVATLRVFSRALAPQTG